MNTKRTFDLWFWCSLLVFAVIIAGICFLPSKLVQPGCLDFRDTGQIGDTIGGIMSPFVAIAASILTFIAFWVQFKANIFQRQDISLERFENNFFEMLHLHKEITKGIMFEIKERGAYTKYYGYDAFDCLYIRADLGDRDKNGVGVKGIFEKFDKETADKIYTSDYYVRCLDHYFRMLYRIIKYVDDSEVITDKQKYDYICIIRATLSWYELLLLFYNGISSNGRDNFKPYIEKYALLNNLRIEELATEEERQLYQSKLDEQYSFSQDEDRDMKYEYKKGAFVHKE